MIHLLSSVFNYLVTPEEFKHYFGEICELLATDKLRVKVHKEYGFTAEDIKESHNALTSGKTTGKLIVKVA